MLDELTYLCTWGWLDTAAVAAAIRDRPAHVNVVVTGRDAPAELVEVADTVTEMRSVKHAYDRGHPRPARHRLLMIDHVPGRRGAQRQERAGRGDRPAPRRAGGVRRHLHGASTTTSPPASPGTGSSGPDWPTIEEPVELAAAVEKVDDDALVDRRLPDPVGVEPDAAR